MSATLAFLAAIFGDMDRGTLFVAGGRREGDRIPRWHDTPYDLGRVTPGKIAVDILRRGQWEEVFVSCAIFAGEKRIESQAVTFTAAYADFDGVPLPESLPMRTVTIESSPEHFHCFWRFHKPQGQNVAVDINRRIAYFAGADKSGADATQVLRPPDVRNWKYPDVSTRLVEVTDRRYDPQDFAWLPPVAHVAPATINLTGDADGLAVWRAVYPYLTAKMRAIAMGDARAYRGDESAADHAFMCALCGAGLTPDEASAAFLVTPRGKNLGNRKGEDRVGYLVQLSVRKAVAHVGTVVQA